MPTPDAVALIQRMLGVAPRSTFPGYDDQTADDPGYDAWSAQRPVAPAPVDDTYAHDVQTRDARNSAALSQPATFDDGSAIPARNNASVALLRQQLGLGRDDGGTSQFELEQARNAEADRGVQRETAAADRADTRKRASKVQDLTDEVTAYGRPDAAAMRKGKETSAIDLATAVPRVTGEYGLKEQALKNTGAVDVERVKAGGLVDAAGLKGGGGGGGKMPGAIMSRIAEGSNAIEGIAQLRKLKGQTWTGPGAGRAQALLQKVPLMQGSDSFAAFTAETAGLKNQIIHALTGAQMSKNEEARILDQIPLPTDQDNLWERKAASLERQTRGLNVRLGLLQAGVPASELDRVSLEVLAEHGDAPPAGAAADDGVANIIRH